MNTSWTRCAKASIGLVLIASALSSCVVYQNWVITASDQRDYPELIEHVRSNELLQSQIDKRTDKTFRVGEPVANWKQIGVDQIALLEAQPGGANKNLFLAEEMDGFEVLESTQSVGNLFGSGYQRFEVAGQQDLFERSDLPLQYSLWIISAGVWLETVTENKIEGTASCGVRSASRLLVRDPLHQLSLGEVGNLAGMIAGMQRLDQNPQHCGFLMPAGDSAWQQKWVTLEGQRLPVAEKEMGLVRIIPLEEAQRMIAEK